MILPISFSGTFKVNNDNYDSFSKFQDYAYEKELEEQDVSTDTKSKLINTGQYGNFDYKAEQTLIVPDHKDKDVETFCARNGIAYKKISSSELLNPALIKARIKAAPEGYRKVFINADALEKLAEHQESNLDHCRKDYQIYYYNNVDKMIKGGDDIPAATLSIYGASGNEDLKKYVDRHGAENLNNNQVFVNFEQKTDDPDHCMYFALRQMGVDKIPAYVDNNSYEAGKILGLF